MQEILRTTVLTIATLIFFGSYFKLLSNAFRRDTLWGIFSLFAAPLGGWLHALTSWWDNSRLLIIHIVTGALAFCAFFLFPRAPMTGFWSEDSSGLVLEVKNDGAVRDYSLAPDSTYRLRPARVITLDLPFQSPLRLRFVGVPEYDLGWYKPGDNTIKLYNSANDPSLINNQDKPIHTLKRVIDPNEASFLVKLELLTTRENIADRAKLLAQNSPGKSIIDLVSEESLARLRHYIALAQSSSLTNSATFQEQIYTLQLRTQFNTLLRGNPTPEKILTGLLQRNDFLLFGILSKMTVESVNVNSGDTKGSVQFVNPYWQRVGPRGLTLNTVKGTDGQWRFDIFQFRDEHIRRTMQNKQGYPAQSAEAYLEYSAATSGNGSFGR